MKNEQNVTRMAFTLLTLCGINLMPALSKADEPSFKFRTESGSSTWVYGINQRLDCYYGSQTVEWLVEAAYLDAESKWSGRLVRNVQREPGYTIRRVPFSQPLPGIACEVKVLVSGFVEDSNDNK